MDTDAMYIMIAEMTSHQKMYMVYRTSMYMYFYIAKWIGAKTGVTKDIRVEQSRHTFIMR